MSIADCIKQATPSCAPTNLFGSGSGTYSDTKSSSSFASKLKQLKTPSVKAESSGPTKLEPKEESKSPSQPKSEGKSKEPKYKLFCIPADGLEPDYCLKYKGTGQNFCLVRGCDRNHTGNGSFSPKPNHGYVLKVSGKSMMSAIDSPEINLDRLSDEFKHEVVNESKTLEEWNNIASNSKSHVSFGGFTKNDHVIAESNTAKYKHFQPTMLHPQSAMKIKSKLRNLEAPDFVSTAPLPEQPDVDDFAWLIGDLDQNLIQIQDFLTNLTDMFKIDHRELEALARATASQFKTFATQIGDRPSILDPDFDVPHLWAGYTTLLQAVKTLNQKLQVTMKESLQQQEEKHSIKLSEAIAVLEQKISQFKSEGARIIELEKKIKSLE